MINILSALVVLGSIKYTILFEKESIKTKIYADAYMADGTLAKVPVINGIVPEVSTKVDSLGNVTEKVFSYENTKVKFNGRTIFYRKKGLLKHKIVFDETQINNKFYVSAQLPNGKTIDIPIINNIVPEIDYSPNGDINFTYYSKIPYDSFVGKKIVFDSPAN